MIISADFQQNRIDLRFDRLKQNGSKALITFVTAGDPDLETTKQLVLKMEEAGADIIELGVPYSDPLADGPVIQQASLRALKSGVNLKRIFQAVKELREITQIPIIIMTYYNPLLKYGLQQVADQARACGVDGFIVPDLPMEESREFSGMLMDYNIYLIPLVAPTSGPERIRRITAEARGFVYCVSLTGVTGVREGVPDNLREFMCTVQEAAKIPLAVGFGISSPEQVSAVSRHCDAVIVGSALVKNIGEVGKSPKLEKIVYDMTKNLKSPLQNTKDKI